MALSTTHSWVSCALFTFTYYLTDPRPHGLYHKSISIIHEFCHS
ncbi:unnamed protein product [Brassica napus]|uniref:(rape) hypothetical protein n=1 Tax=Brassica napus TaxID=3708 RepID=A0A816J016_BRANA|nr:unnamed protein product [Brassica napus]